jgi:hypothetical protein
MPRGRLLLLGALIFVAVPIVGAAPAYACLCTEDADRAHYERAEVVFEGTLPVRPPGTRYSGVATFSPTRVYKGPVLPAQPVETGTADSCGWEPVAPGPYLVFAAANGGSTPEAHGCSGTRLLAEGGPAWSDAGIPPAVYAVYAVGGVGLLALLQIRRARRRRGPRPGHR